MEPFILPIQVKYLFVLINQFSSYNLRLMLHYVYACFDDPCFVYKMKNKIFDLDIKVPNNNI